MTEIGEVIENYCPQCQQTKACIVESHYLHTGGRLTCMHCGALIKFLPKPENKNKRRCKHPLAKDLGIDYCQLCGWKNKEFEGFHTHHLNHDGDNNERSNLIIICNPCHELIHWLQKYHGIKTKFDWIEKVKGNGDAEQDA